MEPWAVLTRPLPPQSSDASGGSQEKTGVQMASDPEQWHVGDKEDFVRGSQSPKQPGKAQATFFSGRGVVKCRESRAGRGLSGERWLQAREATKRNLDFILSM